MSTAGKFLFVSIGCIFYTHLQSDSAITHLNGASYIKQESLTKCACSNGKCDDSGVCIGCNSLYMDPGQNCTKCLDGSVSQGCSSVSECQYSELFCPIGPSRCRKQADKFECLCLPGFRRNTRTAKCQIMNVIHLNITIDNYDYTPSFGNHSSTEFLHLGNVIQEQLVDLMSMSENYIDTTLDSVSRYKQGISTHISVHVWSRQNSEIERMKIAVENYLLKCVNHCFSIASSATLLSTRVGSLCALYPNLCAGYPNTVCVDNMTFHHESSSNKQYICQCEPGFSGEWSYTANDGTIFVCRRTRSLCSPNPCEVNGKCIEHRDGFLCRCPWTRTGFQCENALPVLLVIAMMFIALISMTLVSMFYWSGKKKENHIIITRQYAEQRPTHQQNLQETTQPVLDAGGIMNQSFENTDSEGLVRHDQGTSRGRNAVLDEASLVKEEEIMERSF